MRLITSDFRFIYLAWSLLCIAGCQSMSREILPEQMTPAHVDSAMWTDVSNAREGDWFSPLNLGPNALAWRLRSIHSASDSLDLQTFLWTNDRAGGAIAEALLSAAERGVTVRILLDDSFTVDESEFLGRLNAHHNISCRIYNPFLYRPDSIALRQMFNLGEFSRVDRRMHNKVLVVDNIVSIVGGRNLADEYFGYHSTANFRDMELLVYGETSTLISSSFDDYWNSGWAFPLEELVGFKLDGVEPLRDGRVIDSFLARETRSEKSAAWSSAASTGIAGKAYLLADRPAGKSPDRSLATQLAQRMIAWIDEAESELIAVSAYLIPTPELEAALERAIDRGVRVKVLTNSLRSNNHTAAHAAYGHHIQRLVAIGVEVHEVRALARDRGLYMDDLLTDPKLGLHAKFLLIDDHLSFIGSANLDARSLRLNTEMGLMIQSEPLNQLLREFTRQDFSSANAWRVEGDPAGRLRWKGDNITLDKQPSDSVFQRLEDWFLGVLPIEGEM